MDNRAGWRAKKHSIRGRPKTNNTSEMNALLDLMRSDVPPLNQCVLVAMGHDGIRIWMVGVFREMNGGLWFRQDGTAQGFGIRDVPGLEAAQCLWIPLPNSSYSPTNGWISNSSDAGFIAPKSVGMCLVVN